MTAARSEVDKLPGWVRAWLPGWARRKGDRGGRAKAPLAIPAAGWLDIAVRTVKSALAHNLPTTAAGVAFYGVLAFLPALSAAAALYTLFGAGWAALDQAMALDGLAPKDAFHLVAAEVGRLGARDRSQLVWLAIGGAATATGSLNAAVMGLISGLNTAFGEKECRSWVKRALLAAALTAGLVLVLLASFMALLAGRRVFGDLHVPAPVGAALRFLFLAGLAAMSLALLYRYGPCRQRPRWRWATPGGLLAALSWLSCSWGLSFYLGHFAHYERAYGLLGAVMATMVWLWLASCVTLAGAELNAQIEAQTDLATTKAASSRPAAKRRSARTEG